MAEVRFDVSPGVQMGNFLPTVDHRKSLESSLGGRIEALWKPKGSLVFSEEDHALLTAVNCAFYRHYPLRISPDVLWITLARGFALHVNLHAEKFRERFVRHAGKEKLVVERPDFLPGQDNPWPEAFAEFSKQIGERVGKMRDFVRCDFSTTGPEELAVSELMVMETFQAYFEYEMLAGCGIPWITLTGTVEDWKSIRRRAKLFGEFGLENWAGALDPILEQFVEAAEGRANVDFWRSMFRYHSGSGPSVMTGWMNVLFPYLQEPGPCEVSRATSHSQQVAETPVKIVALRDRKLHRQRAVDPLAGLYPNPYLEDWRERLAIDDKQHFRDRWGDPQGVGIAWVPACLTSVPLKVLWGNRQGELRLIGGLMGVSQNPKTLEVQAECGWAIVDGA